MLLVPGDFSELLRTLFRRGDDGRLQFGPAAQSVLAVSSVAALSDWVEFEDYVMEGHVRYCLRARPHPRGLLLEIRHTGSSRDKYVIPFVADYINWSGHSALSPD